MVVVDLIGNYHALLEVVGEDESIKSELSADYTD